MHNIADIYQKTSIIQMVIGCLLFIGIVINKDNLLAIVHDNLKAQQFDVVILIGLGFLVDITGGLNTYIITTSHKYRVVTLFVIASSIFCIGLNYILIPKYGGIGAAIAYLMTMIGLNFCTWFYIKLRFNMQPFTYRHLLVIPIAFISYLAGHFFWKAPNLYLDILLRSVVTAAIYLTFIYYLKISDDLNEKYGSLINKWILRK
jgi:O-antigen/teichoic acid export membrane protein